MLEFLWHMRGSLALDRANQGEAMVRVAAMLNRQRKPISAKGADFLEFHSPLWGDLFGPNWLALVMFDRGRIWIDRTQSPPALRYDLRSFQSFVFCLAAAGLVSAVCLIGGEPKTGLKFGLLGFAWLYGMNVLLAFARVPSLFKRAARGGGI